MKNLFLSTLIIFSATVASAQMTEGTIIYERKADLHRRMEDEQMKAMVPQFRTDKHELLFRGNETLYRALAEDEAPDPFANSGGPRIEIRIGGPGQNGITYRNYSNAKHLELTDLEDKPYIIDDTIKKWSWKLSDETKTIQGHLCKKATVKTERGSNVVAWYAEDIASPAGPEIFGGLPGAILMMDINDGEMVYNAVAINQELAAKDLKEPSKGSHITRVGFQKKLEELFGAPDEKGRVIMRN